MQPYSLLFVTFVALFVGIHQMVGRSRWREYQWVVLLVASVCFYLLCDARSCVFLLLTSLTTWASALRMRSLDEQGADAAKAALQARGGRASPRA